MQILLDLIHSSKGLPVLFVTHLLDLALRANQEPMIDQLIPILAKETKYQSILATRVRQILDEMKTNDDSKNIRQLEKYHLVFQHSRQLIPSESLSSIIDRLIHSSSRSSISYSVLDTRYLLAMIILNSSSSLEKYSSFLQQTWKSIARDVQGVPPLKPVVIAYAKQWKTVMQSSATIDDIDALVKCLDDQHGLISQIVGSMNDGQFQQWMQQTLQHIKIPFGDEEEEDVNQCRRAFQVLQTLAHCTLNAEINVYFMTIIHSVMSQCGPLLIRLPTECPHYSSVVSSMLAFANGVLTVKRVSLVSMAFRELCCSLSSRKYVLKSRSAYCNVAFIYHRRFCSPFTRPSANWSPC